MEYYDGIYGVLLSNNITYIGNNLNFFQLDICVAFVVVITNQEIICINFVMTLKGVDNWDWQIYVNRWKSFLCIAIKNLGMKWS